MSGMNWKPAFRYRFSQGVRSVAIFCGIMTLITILSFAGVYYAVVVHGARVSGSASFFGVAAAISLFVTGITTIREDVRLMLQNGVGRRTVFVAEILVVLSISLLLAVAGDVLLTATQLATAGMKSFYATDIAQMIFFERLGANLTFAAHIQCILCFFGWYAGAYAIGIFISLMFYRLNKIWTVIVAVGVPLFFVVGLPILVGYNLIPGFIYTAFHQITTFAFRSPWSMLLTSMINAALISLFNWLLMRKAPVKPTK